MRRLVVGAVIVWLVGACGGAGGAGAEGDAVTTSGEGVAEAEGDTGDAVTTSDVSMAIVTIGGSTYEFRSEALGSQCRRGFILLYMADDNGDLLLANDKTSHVNIQTDSVEVSLAAEDKKWYADPGRFGAEASSVDSISWEGAAAEGIPASVVGTATFYSSADEDLVSGSFEASCAG